MDKRSLRLAIIIAAFFIALAIIVPSAAAGCSDGCSSEGGAVVSASDPADTALESSEPSGDAPADPSDGDSLPSDALPERLVNVFGCTALYQRAVQSELDGDTAFGYEQNADLVLGPAYFSCSRFTLENCSFEVDENASWEDIASFGINGSGLRERFGEDTGICSVRVFSSGGEYKTTLFNLGETTLIAFGEGMHVFEYELLEAVG